MRYKELALPYTGTADYPFAATIPLDPAKAAQFLRLGGDAPEIWLLGLDRRDPTNWLAFVASAHCDTSDQLETNWLAAMLVQRTIARHPQI
jgi:hypothetical protein